MKQFPLIGETISHVFMKPILKVRLHTQPPTLTAARPSTLVMSRKRMFSALITRTSGGATDRGQGRTMARGSGRTYTNTRHVGGAWGALGGQRANMCIGIEKWPIFCSQ